MLATDVLLTLLLATILIPIVVIDYGRMIIPNTLNATLLIAGVLTQSVASNGDLTASLLGGGLFFLIFAAVRLSFFHFTGKAGLGFGDVKFAGAAGVWIGPPSLPIFMFLSSVSALVAFSTLTLAGKATRTTRLPFGPFLALGLFCCWLSQAFSLNIQ